MKSNQDAMEKNASNEMLFPKRTGKREPCICFREGILHKKKAIGRKAGKRQCDLFRSSNCGTANKEEASQEW